MESFNHPSLHMPSDKPLVYTAMSKYLFYFRWHVSKFVFEQGAVPFNPFTISEYFLLDTVDRDLVRSANNTLVQRADQIWVFGKVSDGVLAEILQAKKQNKPIRYFYVIQSKEIKEVSKAEVEMEDDVKSFKDQL